MRREEWYALASVPEVSPRKALLFAKMREAGEGLFNIKGKAWSEARLTEFEAEALSKEAGKKVDYIQPLMKMEENGIHMITCEEPDYPEFLKNLAEPPIALFVKGEMPREEALVGMVGARACSAYGRHFAEQIAGDLAAKGVGIVSGLAAGIDGASHEGALQAKNGRTYAVLGCGVDVVYPPGNRRLYEEIPYRGGIISEFISGTRPLSWNFPRRNRLISAFSDILLVLEARKKSGSLITAGYALEQGKEVMALPGRVGEPLSEGCLELLRDGAGLLMSADDVVMSLQQKGKLWNAAATEKEIGPEAELTAEEKAVLERLSFTPVHVDELFETCNLSYPALCAVLLQMELKGLVRQESGQHYVRK